MSTNICIRMYDRTQNILFRNASGAAPEDGKRMRGDTADAAETAKSRVVILEGREGGMCICRLVLITTTGVITRNYLPSPEIDERRVWRRNERVGAPV